MSCHQASGATLITASASRLPDEVITETDAMAAKRAADARRPDHPGVLNSPPVTPPRPPTWPVASPV
jgi:hypothetical protein